MKIKNVFYLNSSLLLALGGLVWLGLMLFYDPCSHPKGKVGCYTQLSLTQSWIPEACLVEDALSASCGTTERVNGLFLDSLRPEFATAITHPCRASEPLASYPKNLATVATATLVKNIEGEWLENGACYSKKPETYTQALLALARTMRTPTSLIKHAGSTLSYQAIASQFPGPVSLVCKTHLKADDPKQKEQFLWKVLSYWGKELQPKANTLARPKELCAEDMPIHLRPGSLYLDTGTWGRKLEESFPMAIAMHIDAIFPAMQKNPIFKQKVLELIDLHKQRGDLIYLITKGRQKQKVQRFFAREARLPILPKFIRSDNAITSIVEKYNIKLLYSPSDAILLQAIKGKAQAARLTVKERTLGKYGETILTDLHL